MAQGKSIAKTPFLSLASHRFSKHRPIIDSIMKMINHVFVKPFNQRVIQELPIPDKRGAYVSRAEDKEIVQGFQELFGDTPPNKTKVIMIHGPEGSGKSYSAGNLAQRIGMWRWPPNTTFHLQNNIPIWRTTTKAPIVRWTLDASNKKALFDSYCNLAKELGMRKTVATARHHISLGSRTSSGRQHHNEARHHVKRDTAMEKALDAISGPVMERLDEERGFVLIVDGAKRESASLAKYWPKGGERRKGEGLVIITTQDPNAFYGGNSNGLFLRKVPVSKMTKRDAMKLLKKCSNGKVSKIGREEACARDIVIHELDGNPQDIAAFGHQLSALKREKGTTVCELRKLLKERKCPDTKAISGLPVLLHMMRNPETSEVFKLLACCSGENPVPLSIIEEFVSDKNDLLSKLQGSDVLEVRKSHFAIMISVHGRQHEGLRHLLNKKEQDQDEVSFIRKFITHMTNEKPSAPTLTHEDTSKAIQCMTKACKGSMQYKSDQEHAMIKLAHPHLKELLQVTIRDLGFDNNIPAIVKAAGHACLGESYLFSGSSNKAVKHLEIALDLYGREVDREHHLEKANILHFLGEAYGYRHLGNPVKGEEHLRRALQMKKDIYNRADNPEIALTLTSLANVLNEQGKHNKAIKFLERAGRIFELTDENDASCVQEKGFVLSGLGSSYRFLGKYQEAEKLLKQALDIFQSIDNPSKLRLGVTHSRLASVQRELGRLDESVASLEQAKVNFGRNKEYQAVVYSKLSVVHRYKGENEQSLVYAEAAKTLIEEQNKIHGHPGLATACLNVGHALSDLGETSEALKHLKNALETYEILHGVIHKTTCTTLNYIGSCLLRRGQVIEGKEHLEQARKIAENIYDSSNPGKANTLKRLSKACRILGELPRSIVAAEEALEICQRAFNDEIALRNREQRKCKTLAAKAYSDLGMHDKARQYMALVRDHIYSHGRDNEAEEARILTTSAEVVLDHVEARREEDNAGLKRVDLKEAGQYIDKAASFSKSDLQTGQIDRERARLLLLQGDVDQASPKVLFSYRKVLEALEDLSDHYVVADVAVLKSDVDREREMYVESRNSLLKALKTYREKLGCNHPKVAKTLLKLSLNSLKINDREKAEDYYRQSEPICDSIKNSLAKQTEQYRFEGSSDYEPEKAFPLFKFQEHIRKTLNLRKRKPGEWA